MSEQGRHSRLPQVGETDLNTVLFEDVTDATHAERWDKALTDQPALTNEILKRAWELSRRANSPHDICRGAIDLGSYVITALELAAERVATVGDDVASRPPSGVPYDGQPAGEPYQAPPEL
jgi:hypothetical protein